MKKISTVFLQAVIVLIGIIALVILIVVPLIEGRATNLSLLEIYSDPFISYGYAASIPFFIAVFKAFKLLGYIGQQKAFSSNAVKALKSIKYCAIVLGILNVTLGLVLKILTLPLSIATFGFFFLVINALMFWAASFVKGFNVGGFWAAFFGALITTIISMVGRKIIED